MKAKKNTFIRGEIIMTTIKDMIHDIEEASEELLVPKKEDHLAKELLKDLLDRAMTEEEIQEIEDKYIKHFQEDEILKIIHGAKLEKGFIKE